MDNDKQVQLMEIAISFGEPVFETGNAETIKYKENTYTIVSRDFKIPVNQEEAEKFKKDIIELLHTSHININESSDEISTDGPPDFHIGLCQYDLSKLFDFTKNDIGKLLTELTNELPSGKRRDLDQPNFLGFYRPFHYYPRQWGIYLDLNELSRSANRLLQYNDRQVPPNKIQGLDYGDCLLLSIFQTFYHEIYHHKIEMLATKFELLTRQPFYKEGVNYYYCATFLTDFCFEESFANVFGLTKCLDYLTENQMVRHPKGPLKQLLRESFLRNSPRGYRLAYELTERGVDAQKFENDFIELLYQFSYFRINQRRGDYTLSSNLWELFTYRLDPLINTENRFTFILPI